MYLIHVEATSVKTDLCKVAENSYFNFSLYNMHTVVQYFNNRYTAYSCSVYKIMSHLTMY